MLKYNLVIFLFVLSTITEADTSHYKDIVLGGRASTMGGAYIAISDDASGTYYNPAGLSLTTGDSISGSAKILNYTSSTYEQVIGSYNWERSSNDFIANFFGVIKKMWGKTFAFSYAIADFAVEHQDESYETPNVDYDMYALNRHTEDKTNLATLSYADSFGKNLNMGLSLSYFERISRSTFHQLEEFSNGEDRNYYSTSTSTELGVKAKLGVIYMREKLNLGFTLGHTMLLKTEDISFSDTRARNSNDSTYATATYDSNRTLPIEIGFGAAYFYSPSLLFAFDFDYYINSSIYYVDIWNISLGAEYYLNRSNALRAGFYTNNDSSPTISTSTLGLTNIDMLGFTFGYTQFSKESSLTLGSIYSFGSGDSQVYASDSQTRKISKSSLSLVMSANYGF